MADYDHEKTNTTHLNGDSNGYTNGDANNTNGDTEKAGAHLTHTHEPNPI